MRIREIMKEKGVTSKEVADKLGVSLSSLNQSISGNPTKDTLEKISDILNVPMWQLFAAPEEVQANPESNGTQIICPHCKKAIPLEIGIRNEAHDNGTTTKQ